MTLRLAPCVHLRQVINAPLVDVAQLNIYYSISTNHTVLRSLKDAGEAEGSVRQRLLVYVL
jgi:hypothetical protein